MTGRFTPSCRSAAYAKLPNACIRSQCIAKKFDGMAESIALPSTAFLNEFRQLRSLAPYRAPMMPAPTAKAQSAPANTRSAVM
jgi:hypothetical protein